MGKRAICLSGGSERPWAVIGKSVQFKDERSIFFMYGGFMRKLLILLVGSSLVPIGPIMAQTVVMRRPLHDLSATMPGTTTPTPSPMPGDGTPSPTPGGGTTSPSPTPTPMAGGGTAAPDPMPTTPAIVADWVQGGLVADVPSCSEAAPAHRQMS